MLKLVKGKQPLPYCYYDGKKPELAVTHLGMGCVITP